MTVSTAPSQDADLDRAVEAAAALGVPEEAVPLSTEEVRGRCSSPRFRRGVLFPSVGTVQPAALVRALRRAAVARGVRVYEGTRATRIADEPRRDAGRPRARARGRLGDERVDDRLARVGPAPDELRQLRRPHGAGTGCARRDRLDRRRGDRRRADVRALLPHDRRRPRADGLGLGADRLRRPRRSPLHARRAVGSESRGGAPRALARARGASGRTGLGWPGRRLLRPPSVLRHRGGRADPLRRRLLGERRRPELARRPDPRLARPRHRRRVVSPAAHDAARAVVPARAAAPSRRRADPLGDPRASRTPRIPGAGRRPGLASSRRFRAVSACASGRASRRRRAVDPRDVLWRGRRVAGRPCPSRTAAPCPAPRSRPGVSSSPSFLATQCCKVARVLSRGPAGGTARGSRRPRRRGGAGRGDLGARGRGGSTRDRRSSPRRRCRPSASSSGCGSRSRDSAPSSSPCGRTRRDRPGSWRRLRAMRRSSAWRTSVSSMSRSNVSSWLIEMRSTARSSGRGSMPRARSRSIRPTLPGRRRATSVSSSAAS